MHFYFWHIVLRFHTRALKVRYSLLQRDLIELWVSSSLLSSSGPANNTYFLSFAQRMFAFDVPPAPGMHFYVPKLNFIERTHSVSHVVAAHEDALSCLVARKYRSGLLLKYWTKYASIFSEQCMCSVASRWPTRRINTSFKNIFKKTHSEWFAIMSWSAVI